MISRTHGVAFASGALFALGLGLGGMTEPTRVLAFLDVAGRWDPTLLLVMAGAILAHMPFALRARRPGARPVLAEHYGLPPKAPIDARLLAGAVLFGIGWGMAGFCPGPALASISGLADSVLLFLPSMLGGMLLYAALAKRWPKPK